MSQLPADIQAYGIELHALHEADIEQVRQWRNHPDVARYMLTQDHISAEQQQAWFSRVKVAADRAYFIIHYQHAATGFASVTSEQSIPLEQAETLEAAIYFAPDSPCRNNLMAFAPALALNDACFEHLPCQHLKAIVKADNEAALRFNKTMGYDEHGRDGDLIELNLTRDSYFAATGTIKSMLSRNSADAARRPHHADQ